MRFFVCAMLAVLLIGCGTVSDKPHEGELSDTNSAVRDQSATGGEPERMPGGVGLTAGQSGTGTTSGASTGN